MTEIVFSPEARSDLLEIGDYVAFKLHNRSAARKLLENIEKTVTILKQFPKAGTQLEHTAPHVLYRYLICGSYMIFYHLSGETACVDRILYGRRDYLTILFGNELNEDMENL